MGTNLHSQEDLDESKPEEADLEFITSTLESFSKPRSMPALHTPRGNPSYYDNFYKENLPDDASLRGCAKHQAMPPIFNYKPMIKMPTSRKISSKSTLDTDTVDHWDEIDDKPEISEAPVALPINSIAGTKEGLQFSTSCPFIPSNSHSNSLQNLSTRPSSQLYSAPQSLSPELPR
jgi:hypothetical protein